MTCRHLWPADITRVPVTDTSLARCSHLLTLVVDTSVSPTRKF